MIARSVATVCLLALPSWADDSGGVLLRDTFKGDLAKKRWELLRIHDVRSDRIATHEGRLAVALDTLRTNDATVKLRGVRSHQVFVIPAQGPPLRISCTLDWNGQRNGSYLTAGVGLLPERRKKTGSTKKAQPLPHDAREALVFEYVGVPPGRNARPYLWWRTFGGLRPLYTEGWPQPRREERTGRRIRRVRITLEISAVRVRLLEDGRKLFEGSGTLKGRVQLVLFVTSHSNYPKRTVFFDEVRVERVGRSR